MAPLDDNLRRAFEKAVINARDAAEAAARTALTALALEREVAPAGFGSDQRRLRNALRARARQLGNGDMAAGTPLLVEEIAYEQWHRMLFARFLAENELLMHPAGAPVSLQDCADLALEAGDGDAWQVATGFAARMLPGIFIAGAPAAQVRLAPEDLQRLERILAGLPVAVFTSDDGLGWAYQFWQAKKKDEVNRSGRKIGGADLSPVTQLFTEDYMVQFLLHNSLGAWWAARHPASPLVQQLEYLRWMTLTPQPPLPSQGEGESLTPLSPHGRGAGGEGKTPAAGTFPGWPQRAAEVTVIDPCCGSGHFLVAAFELLRRMRMEEEGLSAAAATEAVLRDNLFGLELDARCTQIAAFALAFAAWKAAGYRPLPLPNIACSGVPLAGSLEEWTRLAGDDSRLRSALERLYHLFKNAPDLGSLINPADLPLNERMFSADYREVEPLLERALAAERGDDPAAAVFGDAARGVLHAARLLARQYTLVATNVPYLTSNKHGKVLKIFCKQHHSDAKLDLATTFIERCRSFSCSQGVIAIVSPQNWLFLSSYQKFRSHIIAEQTLNLIARIGEKGFRSVEAAGAFTALSIITNHPPEASCSFTSIDVSSFLKVSEKSNGLKIKELTQVEQLKILKNTRAVIILGSIADEQLLSVYVTVHYGSKPGQTTRVTRYFWEVPYIQDPWQLMESTPNSEALYTGKGGIVLTLRAVQQYEIEEFGVRGREAWGKRGVILSQMRYLPCSIYLGCFFDNNTSVILPKDKSHLAAIYAFMRSGDFPKLVRTRNQKVDVDTGSMVGIPFDWPTGSAWPTRPGRCRSHTRTTRRSGYSRGCRRARRRRCRWSWRSCSATAGRRRTRGRPSRWAWRSRRRSGACCAPSASSPTTTASSACRRCRASVRPTSGCAPCWPRPMATAGRWRSRTSCWRRPASPASRSMPGYATAFSSSTAISFTTGPSSGRSGTACATASRPWSTTTGSTGRGWRS
jgi:hypothetical protein